MLPYLSSMSSPEKSGFRLRAPPVEMIHPPNQTQRQLPIPHQVIAQRQPRFTNQTEKSLEKPAKIINILANEECGEENEN